MRTSSRRRHDEFAVIASEAKQSRAEQAGLDYFVAFGSSQ
jgi:hypothetical protein